MTGRFDAILGARRGDALSVEEREGRMSEPERISYAVREVDAGDYGPATRFLHELAQRGTAHRAIYTGMRRALTARAVDDAARALTRRYEATLVELVGVNPAPDVRVGERWSFYALTDAIVGASETALLSRDDVLELAERSVNGIVVAHYRRFFEKRTSQAKLLGRSRYKQVQAAARVDHHERSHSKTEVASFMNASFFAHLASLPGDLPPAKKRAALAAHLLSALNDWAAETKSRYERRAAQERDLAARIARKTPTSTDA